MLLPPLLSVAIILANAVPAKAAVDIEDEGISLPVWPTGEFALTRTELAVPAGGAQIYWQCVGGTMGLRKRLVVFAPGTTFDAVAIDTTSWQDPPNDWNATLNANAEQITSMFSLPTHGVDCQCMQIQLDFGEWLVANSKMGSSIAADFFQGPNVVPSNWLTTSYLPSDENPWTIQTVYAGAPMASVAEGWTEPLLLSTTTSTLVDTNKFLKIEDSGEPFILRVMSEKVAYGIVVYLIEENPDPNEPWPQNDGPVNPMELFTSEIPQITDDNDLTQATAMSFAPARDGHYYSISIRNGDETDLDSMLVPPFTCSHGDYGLQTKNTVMYSIEPCNEIACDGETIEVVPNGGGGTTSAATASSLAVQLPLFVMTCLVIFAHAVGL